MHRLAPAVNVPLEEHVAEDADLRRLVLGLQRQVGRLPVTPHTVALEGAALRTDRLGCERRRLLAQLDRRESLALRLVHRLEDLELDREPMAVPAGNVAHLAPTQQLVPVDDVLEDLVQRVPDVQVAVGIRWPVVQHKRRARVLLGELGIDLLLLPEALQLWFARR